MIKLIHLLTRNAWSSGSSTVEVEFSAALTRMQNALQVLERTLNSIDRELPESLSGNTVDRNSRRSHGSAPRLI